MKPKPYNGYQSFQYLEPEIDYKPFRLARQVGRVEPYIYPVTPEQEAEVQRLLEENIVFSLHDHTFVTPEDVSQIFEYNRLGRNWTGYEGLSVSGLDVVVENFMDGTAMITSRAGWKWTDVIHDIGIRFSDFVHQDMVFVAQTLDDLYRAKREGKIALIPCLESATPIENELDRVDVLYGLGIRIMGITYSESNALGSGLREANDGGLTQFGRQVVRRMNKLGMTIDTSHCGDKTTLDTIEASEKPTFITHAGARVMEHEPAQDRRRDPRLRRKGRGDRYRGRAAHHADREASPPLDRIVYGALRVCRQSGGHRSCRVRARHSVRRPCGAAPRFRRGALDQRGARQSAVRGSSLRQRSGEPGRSLPQRDPLAGGARLQSRRDRQGPGPQCFARAEGNVGALTPWAMGLVNFESRHRSPGLG